MAQIASPRTAKRPTLADVAKRVGCSTTIVSKVVNHSSSSCNASPQLSARIREAVRELDYQPSFASQSLARQSARTIGVYVPAKGHASFADPYEGEILRGVEQVCHERGFDWLAINLTGDTASTACRAKFAQRRIDGLLMLHVADDEGWAAELIAQGSPVAAINYYGEIDGLLHVNFDGRAAVRLAMEHLSELGHQKIGYLGVLTDAGPGATERADAYREWMTHAGLTVDSRWVVDHSNPLFSDRSAYRDFEQGVDRSLACLLETPREHWPTALVCYSDFLALRLIGELHDAGVSLPDDLSIIGIDNLGAGDLIRPRLTTIAQPLAEMGRRAAEYLIDASVDGVDQTSPSPPDSRFAPRLVVRDSTRPVS